MSSRPMTLVRSQFAMIVIPQTAWLRLVLLSLVLMMVAP